VLVPHFIDHPKYFPIAVPLTMGFTGDGPIRSRAHGLGISEQQKFRKVKMISLSFMRSAC
jgi:hypothetical protein